MGISNFAGKGIQFLLIFFFQEKKKKRAMATVQIQRIGVAFAVQFYDAISQENGDPYLMLDSDTIYTSGDGTDAPWQQGVAGANTINLDNEMKAFGGKQVQLLTVDTQETVDEGMLVLVNGATLGADSPTPRLFVQTFFLGKDPEGGWFIRNTILRFLVTQVKAVTEEPVQVQEKASPKKT